MFHRAMQRFDAIHTVNPAVVRAYEASTAKPVFCITNSVAVPGGQPADYLAHRRIIAAGRHAPAKNFDVLLRAFAIVRESFPEWTLDIFGKGELTDELAALRVQLGLEDAVTLRDPTPNLLDEMRASAFHVSSSRAESFGLTMAEAMSVGLPVLSHRRNAGAAYLLADGRGFIARSNDVESLVEAMEDMIRRIESGDADGTLARTVASGMAFVRRISSDAVIASWKSEINRLYDRKIERLYA
jgi:glycosyltransferase involved in cell wall biosynthesis